jgi:hypothetical protein
MKKYYATGKKIFLRGLEKGDLRGNMFNWANDQEVTYDMYMGLKPNSIEIMEKEYDTLIASD